MDKQVIYEQPLNEKVRTLLRLEHLFKQVAHSLEGTSPRDSRTTVLGILDLLSIFERTDLKAEIAKELERDAACLMPLEHTPGVDQERLGQILDKLRTLAAALHGLPGPIGQSLRGNEFLTAIMQRTGIPGGTGDFDLPAYHYWLEHPPEQRIADLKQWFQGFEAVQDAVTMLLSLLRQSAPVTMQTASGGLFQQDLPADPACQLVRVGVPAQYPVYAQISGGKHRFCIRFMVHTLSERPTQTSESVEFSLTCCAL